MKFVSFVVTKRKFDIAPSSMKRLLHILREALSGSEKEYTSGSIDKAIILLSIPMVLEMAMESLFALVDIFFVSKIGTMAVATVALTEVVLMIIESVALGIAMAATAMIARRIGEGDKDKASDAAMQTIFLGLIISVGTGVLCFFTAERILLVMGASPELVTSGVWYTRLILGFNIVLFFLFLLNAIFRGAGDAAIAMRTLWIANGINIILDPCLIFGWGPFPEMGVVGAAIATTIGRGTGIIYQVWHLTSGRSLIKLMQSHIRWISDVIRRLINVSIGGAAQFLIATASWVFLVRIVSMFGEQALAGYMIAVRVIIFSILPAWGMSNATATLVGQNLGAGKPERAEKSVWRSALFTVIFLAAVSVIYILFAPAIVSIFTSDPVVLHHGVLCLRIFSIGYVCFAYGLVISQAFNGAGDTRTPTVMNFVCFWLIQIPLAYVMARVLDFGPSGVFYAVVITETLLAAIAIVLFRRGKWKEQKI